MIPPCQCICVLWYQFSITTWANNYTINHSQSNYLVTLVHNVLCVLHNQIIVHHMFDRADILMNNGS